MHHDRFEGFLWGQVLLFGLLGASLALFLAYPSLRAPYSLPELKLVLATLFAIAGGLVAVLSATRFSIEGRRYDLLLTLGFFVLSVSWGLFTIVPAIVHHSANRTELWAAITGRMVGWALIAAAPFVHGRVRHRKVSLWNGLLVSVAALIVVWGLSRSLGASLPNLDPRHDPSVPSSLTGALAAQALVNLLAVLGFGNRFRQRAEDLDYWLALGSTLALFASLHFIFTPLIRAGDVSQGDYLRLFSYGVLLVGVWRAIRSTEFGRAVAEERARVAADIHDGLAQYLFAVSTHASMLEAGADPAQLLPRLKEAAIAAQQEARYAILALSSASGRAPFDAALRRYIDVLTADGALEVELDIDSAISLRPDEQIELFGSCRRASRTRVSTRAHGTRGCRSASAPAHATSRCATTGRASPRNPRPQDRGCATCASGRRRSAARSHSAPLRAPARRSRLYSAGNGHTALHERARPGREGDGVTRRRGRQAARRGGERRRPYAALDPADGLVPRRRRRDRGARRRARRAEGANRGALHSDRTRRASGRGA
jgi:signal transduction histidine kinase